ncbi:IS1182 family transposase [Hoeflea sp. CAU 1731]
MMGPKKEAQAALFYEFDLDRHVPADHVLRQIDRFVDLSGIRSLLAPYYSSTGRPSIDPELMIRMLLVGYCMGIRSERRLCDEVHLNLAYRWFCRLDLNDAVPDHSTFSKNRHGRFRQSDLFRHLFNTVLKRCIAVGLVGGDDFGVDASLIKAYASRYTKVELADWNLPDQVSRATQEYLDTLDDAAFGGATPVQPKSISPADPAARYTGANGDRPFLAYSTNYLVDLDNAVIVDVDATAPIRQAEVEITREMIPRTRERFGLYPEKLVADTAYGSAPMLGWLVEEEGIEPFIPVIDKSQRSDGTFSRDDFTYDNDSDSYTCPAGKQLVQFRRTYKTLRLGVDKEGLMRFRASKKDCEVCPLRQRCCPKEPARKILRSIHEGARNMARDITKTDAYVTASYARKKVEMLFAHLKRILRFDRLRLRGPNGAKDEFIMAATVQNLRKLAKLVPNPA